MAWARQDWPAAERGFRKLLAQELPVDLRAQALRWLRAETVSRLNQGMDIADIITGLARPLRMLEEVGLL